MQTLMESLHAEQERNLPPDERAIVQVLRSLPTIVPLHNHPFLLRSSIFSSRPSAYSPQERQGAYSLSQVKPQNRQHILLKNVSVTCLAAIAWFSFGYGIAFGEDSYDAVKGGGLYGIDHYFAGEKKILEKGDHRGWFFQYTFCATAATIVSGAVAERVKLCGFLVGGYEGLGFLWRRFILFKDDVLPADGAQATRHFSHPSFPSEHHPPRSSRSG